MKGTFFSAALDRGTYFLVGPRSDNQVHLYSSNLEVADTFDLSNIQKTSQWSDYVKGVFHLVLEKASSPTFGFNALIFSNVPLGAGLSSSAALEVSATLALNELYLGGGLDRVTIAKLCQNAENNFVGMKCGLLDHFSSLFGRDSGLVLTDFRTLEVRNISLSERACFLICNTNAQHTLVGSEYNERRECCEQGTRFFAQHLNKSVAALRDVTSSELEEYSSKMEPIVSKRCAHIIGENERVVRGTEILTSTNLADEALQLFGELMFQSHRSSQTNFENSSRELDIVVDKAQQMSDERKASSDGKALAVYGARLSGGGFGGSAVLLIDRKDSDAVTEALKQHFLTVTGTNCSVFVVNPSNGAHLIA